MHAANDLKEMKDFYFKEAVNCIDFWCKNGVDRKYGGYFTSLDREGRIFGADKSGWFQGRGLWTFSKAYNVLEKRPEWLEAARLGYEFLKKHCYDADGRMFFVVTADGRPVQKRRYYFSETFAVVGLAEYYKATGEREALALAQKTYETVLRLYENPSLSTPKYYPGTFKMKGLAVPMILTVTTQVLREADPENAEKYDRLIEGFIGAILDDFLKPQEKVLFENVGENGERLDSPKGRLVNPGHSIEASWFILSEGLKRKDDVLIRKSLDILDWSFDIGWDKEYGGLMYFIDIEGKPCEQLEWDMKLWWPHTEALIAFLMAYKATGKEEYLNKFQMVHDYSFSRFSDKEYGEWYGYLHRDGSVSNTLKGNLFKGPFHLPRALMLNYLLL